MAANNAETHMHWDRAELNDIPIDCETIQDAFEKSLARHELPGRNRTLLEDMGQNARTVSLRCYFWDENYNTHRELLKLLESETIFTLTHPAYGLLHGGIGNVSVRHDDKYRYAEIDLEFVEGESAPAPVSAPDVKGTTESAYVSGLEQAQESYEGAVTEDLGSEAAGIMAQVLDPAKDILEQFTGISRNARQYIKTVDAVVQGLEAALQSVATPANALISTITFSSNLPGRVLGAMAKAAGRYSTLYDNMKDAPGRFLQSFKDGMTALSNSIFSDSQAEISMKAAYNTAVALEAGMQTGAAFAADNEKRQAQKALENTRSFDAEGTCLHLQPDESYMNVREIEQALYAVDEIIQAAVDGARENRALKDMAWSLARHAADLKRERGNLVEKTLDNPVPLHLICLKYGLPYKTADRLLSVNNIPEPNFTRGTINVFQK